MEDKRLVVSILEANLKDVISPFSRKLAPLYLNLAPEEMEGANLVRHGKTTKQMAEFLTLSTQAIGYHRKSIRNKLGIKNRKTNLRTHLLST